MPSKTQRSQQVVPIISSSGNQIEIVSDTAELTIIVPAWKPDFLHAALSSIAQQTDCRYRVLVCDDAGPKDIRVIANAFPQFAYHRFANNLGGSDLVSHWHRCIALASTSWVWLFSDDDLMERNCVSEFYSARKRRPDCAVFQFRVLEVSEDLGKTTNAWTPHDLETAEGFVQARFKGDRLSCVPDHIFQRERFLALKGFVNLPLAWNSDDATWARIGRENGIGGIPYATVYWRQSGKNISTQSSNFRRKLRADIEYLAWLRSNNFYIDIVTRHNWLANRIANLYRMGSRDIVGLFWSQSTKCWPALGIALIKVARSWLSSARRSA